MTDLLKDMLDARAGSLEPARVDLLDIVREGNRRVSRRRNTLVAVGVAAAVMMATGLPRLLVQPTPSAREFSFASAFEAGSPSYAVGSRVTIDHHTFDTGHPVQVMVQTTDGVVFIDDDGAVFASSGGEATKIGTSTVLSDSTFVLESDGTLAGWVGNSDSGGVVFTVYDQATGKTSTSDYEHGGSSNYTPALWAIDDGRVWLSDGRGVVRWDVASDAQTEVRLPTWRGLVPSDVSAGVIAYAKPGPDGTAVLEFGHSELAISGVESSLHYVVDLSPDGSTALGYADEGLHQAALADTSTGEVTPIAVPEAYGAILVYGWADSDTFLGVGYDKSGSNTPADLLTCKVSGGCQVAVKEAGVIKIPGDPHQATSDALVVANGWPLAALLPSGPIVGLSATMNTKTGTFEHVTRTGPVPGR